MACSGFGARSYLALAVVASTVSLTSGCSSARDDSAPPEGAELAPAALEAVLLGPEGWALAQAWVAEAGACPGWDAERGALSGGCDREDGARVEGSVAVTTAPNGGTWTFAGFTVEQAGLRRGWNGLVSWVRTDEANHLTAVDLQVSWAGAWSGQASLSGASFALDALGQSAGVQGALVVEGVPIELSGAWDHQGCALGPVAGTLGLDGGGADIELRFDSDCTGCAEWDGGRLCRAGG